ncbi:hypothetical protein ACSLNH_05115 [Comamonas kerstersii]|uniref:hypothetical protein n=1 Tax=Comamonas kerstersii TaxID=225992 RepID=UPI003EE024EE
MLITTQHLYSVPDYKGSTGYCAKGSRQWFAAHGLNWADFVAHGLDASVLIATGDALALRLVEHAHAVAAAEAAAAAQQEAHHGG